LKLHQMGASLLGAVWPLPLLAPYLERITDRTGVSPLSIVLERTSGLERNERSKSAILSAIGQNGIVVRRPDGRPEVIDERCVSASHCGDVTMAVAGGSPLACDIESVNGRAADFWRDLLTEDGFRLAQVLSRLVGDDADVAATRVWTALECLRKYGAPADARLTLCNHNEGCVLLSSGSLSIMTVCVTIAGLDRVILSILTGSDQATTGPDHSVLSTKRLEVEMEAHQG